MRRLLAAGALCLAAAAPPPPALHLAILGESSPAIAGAHPGCDATDIPDAPARAIRLASGEVQLYAPNSRNRRNVGPDLLHLHHVCSVVMTGGRHDDPAAYDDFVWIASPWIAPDGTIDAIIHDEFHGHLRPALCPSRRYMDCWYNALTAARSDDHGASFHRIPGLVAALPYRYDTVGLGHHGYFNPSNIVTRGDRHVMFAFATHSGLQRNGNCLLQTKDIGQPASWRGWDGQDFAVTFIDPYTDPAPPETHVCAPVAPGSLRWPVTSLVRHAADGLFIVLMLDAGHDGGIYYATSPDLLTWSAPALLMPVTGEGAWTCADPSPYVAPSLLDPASMSPNFETVGEEAELFVIRFNIADCRIGLDRELVRWRIRISPT